MSASPGSRSLRRGALTLVAAFAAAACARNPATGQNQIVLISEAQEIAMGQAYDSEVVATIGLYPDSALQAHIQQLGAQLAATSERPGLPWTFRIVDDPAVNAFALPGGHIFITRGILASLSSEAELAGVMGHEIGHVTARHSAVQMSREQLFQLGLGLGAVASSTVARYAGNISQGLQVLSLKFSRDDESQADDLGLRYMQRARFDPRAMPGVFTMLARESQASGGGRVPEWLETHPDPEHRFERISQAVAALPQDFSGTVVGRDAYLQRLPGLVYGTNPRQGFFAGNRFLHPDLRFQITFPQGWATNNGAQAVTAVSPAQDAALILSQANAANPDDATRAFVSRQGITAGTSARASFAGLAAVTTPFAATSDGGAVQGTVAFVQLGTAVYQMVSFAPDARWSTYQAAAEQAMRSFQRLTDPAALNVQPQRLAIVRLARRTTIAALATQRPSPVAAAVLARINNVEPDSMLEAGTLVKWVTGQPLPGQ